MPGGFPNLYGTTGAGLAYCKWASLECAREEVMSDLSIDSSRRFSAAACFVTAVLFLMFSNGRFPIAICAWLGPVFLLRFTRGGSGMTRLPLAYLGLSFAFGNQFYRMTPFGGSAYWIFSAAFGIALLIPYVADRYLLTRSRGLLRSLVFPVGLVVSEYLASFNPFGTWGSVAYTQYEYLPLLQLLSVGGLYGITFVMGWLASVTNSLWESGFAIGRVRRVQCLWAGVSCGPAIRRRAAEPVSTILTDYSSGIHHSSG